MIAYSCDPEKRERGEVRDKVMEGGHATSYSAANIGVGWEMITNTTILGYAPEAS